MPCMQCAVAVQEAIAAENAGGTVDEPMQLRIGVHVGDIMVAGTAADLRTEL
jgi:class 3 adenylate cyclase